MFNFKPLSHTKFDKTHRKHIKEHLLDFGGSDELIAMYDKTEQNSSDTWLALWVMWIFIIAAIFVPLLFIGWVAAGLVFIGLMIRDVRYHSKFKAAWRETTRRYFKEKYNIEYTGR